MLLLDQLDVLQREMGCLGVNQVAVLTVDKGGVADVDVVDAVHVKNAAGLDGGAGAPAGDVGDVDVLEVGSHLELFGCELLHESLLVVLVGGLARGFVFVVALEDDGLVLDVGHHDVRDVQLLGLAASSDAALEAQTGVGAAEAVVAHHHATDAADGLAAQHEASVGMIDGVVLDDNVLAAVGGRLGQPTMSPMLTSEKSMASPFCAFHGQRTVTPSTMTLRQFSG